MSLGRIRAAAMSKMSQNELFRLVLAVGGCSDTALRRSDMALLGIVGFIFGHLITRCYLTKHI